MSDRDYVLPEIKEVVVEERALATIRRIKAIDPIEGADRIEVVTVDGWRVISQKDIHKVGDLVVYFEIDSFLPELPCFEFLRKECFKSTKNLGDGFRLRSKKMRGVVSQGLIMSLDHFFYDEELAIGGIAEGDNVTGAIGVQKYDKPIPLHLAGKVRRTMPYFIRKTDQERIQNLVGKVPLDSLYEVTTKLDGSSMTVYFNAGDYGVCSRTQDLKTDEGANEGNSFVDTARKLDLYNKLASLGLDIAIQGELMGPGIQGNRENFDDFRFSVYDVWDIKGQSYYSPRDRIRLIEDFGLDHVPIIFANYLIPSEWTTDDYLKFAEHKSINHPIAEGVVFKSHDGQFSFKAISNQFLLKCED